ALLTKLLDSPNEHLRSWAIQLECEDKAAADAVLAKYADLAKSDPSPVVRLFLASGLQRLPLEQRWAVAEQLIKHGEDAKDHNLELMYWYAIEPLVGADKPRGLKLAAACAPELGKLRQFIARRATEK
ncbi:MAG: dehydrogenase, partial [Rhodobacteraceae bacterium]|nr:dehydrogenase [Paracoccaceae bacterium]